MKFKMNKNAAFFIGTVFVMVLMVWFGTNTQLDFGINLNENVTYPRGRVIEVVVDETEVDEEGVRRGRQELLVELLTGPRRGEVVEAQNILFIDAAVYAQVGERIVLFFDYQEGDIQYFARVHAYERATAMYVIAILFVGLLVAVGGKSGLRAAFGLFFTFVTLLFFLIPSIVRGASPSLMTVMSSVAIIVVSLISLTGFEKKTYVSIMGTSIGILFYSISYLLVSNALRLTGFNIPEMTTLITVGFQANARISEFLFCSIMIASLGAVMDTTVSISSTTAELRRADEKISFQDLFRSSMRMARDCIGSSANTLVLAFTGAFFITLILFQLNNFDYHMIIHRADIAVEVLRIVTASVGMILAGPATALIGSYVYSNQKKKAKIIKARFN